MKTPLNRRSFLRGAASALALSGCYQDMAATTGPKAVGEREQESAQRPNVIFIMTDDQGYGDVGCLGNPVLKTPHIDRLADEGVRLTNFHVHSFCSPTRAALMSGLHPGRTGVTATTGRRDILRTDVPTMADWFKASGYRTALFGKWHIGDGYRYSPQYRGFEETMTVSGGGVGTVGDFWQNNRWNDTLLRNGKHVRYEGFVTDALFTEAMNYIEAIDGAAPFFIYLPTFAPHHPWFLAPEWAEPYMKHGANLAYFYGTISRIDYNVGRLREFLKARGLDRNTILIFTTDNGSVSFESIRLFSGGHRGRKGSLEEHGHRVPCFVHWPRGGLDYPRDIPALTAHMDWLPTFVELCHLKKPALEGLPFDGVSMASLLVGKETSGDPKWANRMYTLRNSKGRVIMKGRWRLINRKLTHLDEDPNQEKNVAGQHPEIVASMEAFADELRKSIGQTSWRSNRPVYLGGPEEHLCFRTAKFFQQGSILAGKRTGGKYPLHFLKGGTYECEFRRWARELNQPLDASITVEAEEHLREMGRPVYVNGGGSKGKALPIAAVRLEMDSQTYEAKAEPGAAAITLKFTAREGPATMNASLLDKHGQHITGPYYIYIRRVSE